MTLEEAAREARYAFLADVCRKVGAGYIVTGHTQNDNVETILLHIVRGSGTRGLVGLRPLTPRTIGDRELVIVRPMLDITREETLITVSDWDLNRGLMPPTWSYRRCAIKSA